MKTLRRQVLISERDYLRMRGRARRLYDRVEFAPVTCTEIQHEYLLNILSSTNPQSASSPPDLKYPAQYLNSIRDRLYDVKYVQWHSYQDNDLIYVKSRGNARPSYLGWARFERDYL